MANRNLDSGENKSGKGNESRGLDDLRRTEIAGFSPEMNFAEPHGA
jgi:hypothetical protein